MTGRPGLPVVSRRDSAARGPSQGLCWSGWMVDLEPRESPGATEGPAEGTDRASGQWRRIARQPPDPKAPNPRMGGLAIDGGQQGRSDQTAPPAALVASPGRQQGPADACPRPVGTSAALVARTSVRLLTRVWESDEESGEAKVDAGGKASTDGNRSYGGR